MQRLEEEEKYRTLRFHVRSERKEMVKPQKKSQRGGHALESRAEQVSLLEGQSFALGSLAPFSLDVFVRGQTDQNISD